jgi:hypothetical protein
VYAGRLLWVLVVWKRLGATSCGCTHELSRSGLRDLVRHCNEGEAVEVLPLRPDCHQAAPVPPFPVSQNFPDMIGGRKLDNYIDWIAPAFLVTLVGFPAASVPAGKTEAGLPVGLQIVGRRFASPPFWGWRNWSNGRFRSGSQISPSDARLTLFVT